MPVIPTVASLMAQLARQCPKCGHRQVIAPSRARETVKCGKCGADIPPRK